MHQETVDKLLMAESDLAFWITRLLSTRGKRNLCFRNRKDPVVGDGHPVGVTPQILNGVAKAVEGFFDVRAPVFLVKAVFEPFPDAGLLQCPAGRRKDKFALLVQSVQEGEILALELIPENPDRDEKFRGSLADLPVRSKAPAGNDAMHMDMIVQFLIPGVEHLDDAGLCAKIFFIGRQFQKSLCTASMEQSVEKFLITVDQRVQFVWECKYHMEVRGVNDFRPPPIHPDFFQHRLAVGTAAVAAGIVVEFHMAAGSTFTDIDPEAAGLAGKDGAGSLLLLFGLKLSGLTVIRIRKPPNLLELKITHGDHLPSGQRG